ncbi:unnamed protein product [Callosobruchus maculatus]|uniref:Uncharacterized protein n=1 Tax=Callosobruchus maculatus TaxID=64391 RepID=A0A653CEA6_CALMS|nr:unnamed protein product [Callosobruchus maculatus]
MGSRGKLMVQIACNGFVQSPTHTLDEENNSLSTAGDLSYNNGYIELSPAIIASQERMQNYDQNAVPIQVTDEGNTNNVYCDLSPVNTKQDLSLELSTAGCSRAVCFPPLPTSTIDKVEYMEDITEENLDGGILIENYVVEHPSTVMSSIEQSFVSQYSQEHLYGSVSMIDSESYKSGSEQHKTKDDSVRDRGCSRKNSFDDCSNQSGLANTVVPTTRDCLVEGSSKEFGKVLNKGILSIPAEPNQGQGNHDLDKKSRKRKRNPKEWKRNIKKQKHNKGEEYVNSKNKLIP